MRFRSLYVQGGAEMRVAAIALGEMREPRAIPGLQGMSQDPDPDVRHAAPEAPKRVSPGGSRP